jgi:hypothetical protein
MERNGSIFYTVVEVIGYWDEILRKRNLGKTKNFASAVRIKKKV